MLILGLARSGISMNRAVLREPPRCAQRMPRHWPARRLLREVSRDQGGNGKQSCPKSSPHPARPVEELSSPKQRIS